MHLLLLVITGLFYYADCSCLPTEICQYVYIFDFEYSFDYECDGTDYKMNFWNTTTDCDGDADSTVYGTFFDGIHTVYSTVHI